MSLKPEGPSGNFGLFFAFAQICCFTWGYQVKMALLALD
jgi:hypothetical protein